jgi:hypothetical protein
MERRKSLINMSLIEMEACITLPIEEIESFDNSNNFQLMKFNRFNSKAVLNKERALLYLENISEKTKEKIDSLIEVPLEKLTEMILSRRTNFQFRNMDKLEKEDLIEILSDYYLLEDMEENE